MALFRLQDLFLAVALSIQNAFDWILGKGIVSTPLLIKCCF